MESDTPFENTDDDSYPETLDTRGHDTGSRDTDTEPKKGSSSEDTEGSATSDTDIYRDTAETGITTGSDTGVDETGSETQTESTDSDAGDALPITPEMFVTSWDPWLEGVSGEGIIQLPLVETGMYDFVVDWGDGTSDTVTQWNAPETRHEYAQQLCYQVRITGTLSGWRFLPADLDENNLWRTDGHDYRNPHTTVFADEKKLLTIDQWGRFEPGNAAFQFFGCSNLRMNATDGPDLSDKTSLRGGFAYCTSLGESTGDMSAWDTHSIADMPRLFSNTGSFNLDIGDRDTANITDMGHMFHAAIRFNQDIGGWNTSSVTDMNAMFTNAASFNQNLSSWDVTAVERLDYAFDNCGLSTGNYDALLIGWAAQDVHTGVTLGAEGLQYSAGAAAEARQKLQDDYQWAILDNGMAN